MNSITVYGSMRKHQSVWWVKTEAYKAPKMVRLAAGVMVDKADCSCVELYRNSHSCGSSAGSICKAYCTATCSTECRPLL